MRTLFSVLFLLALFSNTAKAEESVNQQILGALNSYHQAELEGDLDGILNAYADDFVDPQGATKSMLAEFFMALVSQGLLNDLKVDMSSIVIEVEGERASAGPVSYSTALGTNTYSYQMRKDRDGSWRFIRSRLIN